jgi:hypothetical protein
MRAAEEEGGQESGTESLWARIQSLRETQKRLVAELQEAIERSKELHRRISDRGKQ